MEIVEYTTAITNELHRTLSAVSKEQADSFIQAVMDAKRIFVAGAGRSLLMIRGLAMRLMHLGFTAYVVGETTTPAITSSDLLIIASGSGETGSLKNMAAKAKDMGAALALISIYPKSAIGLMADYVIEIPATTSKVTDSNSQKSIQPGASLFEQSVLLLGDSLILKLSEQKNIKNQNEGLMKLHANLE